jgi:hypothetical protein
MDGQSMEMRVTWGNFERFVRALTDAAPRPTDEVRVRMAAHPETGKVTLTASVGHNYSSLG